MAWVIQLIKDILLPMQTQTFTVCHDGVSLFRDPQLAS